MKKRKIFALIASAVLCMSFMSGCGKDFNTAGITIDEFFNNFTGEYSTFEDNLKTKEMNDGINKISTTDGSFSYEFKVDASTDEIITMTGKSQKMSSFDNVVDYYSHSMALIANAVKKICPVTSDEAIKIADQLVEELLDSSDDSSSTAKITKKYYDYNITLSMDTEGAFTVKIEPENLYK